MDNKIRYGNGRIKERDYNKIWNTFNVMVKLDIIPSFYSSQNYHWTKRHKGISGYFMVHEK